MPLSFGSRLVTIWGAMVRNRLLVFFGRQKKTIFTPDKKKQMEQILYIEMDDMIKHVPSCQSYGNELIVVEMKGSDPQKPEEEIAIRLNAFSVLLVCHGEVDLTIDGVSHHITANSLIDIMERHAVKGIRLSPDFRGYHVITSKNILSETLFNSRRPPIASIASIRVLPIHRISATEKALLEACVLHLLDSLARPDHAWQRDLVINDLRGFFIEMKNILFKSYKESDKLNLPTRDELMFLFIQLLDKHCREEHSVGFYADQLCVTPSYLSSVLKNLSGKTVTKWISEALMHEAQKLLREPELTLQQIADELNFSDQSSFGKFFKKNGGISPMMYREQR